VCELKMVDFFIESLEDRDIPSLQEELDDADLPHHQQSVSAVDTLETSPTQQTDMLPKLNSTSVC
jgi:hypothetical protein